MARGGLAIFWAHPLKGAGLGTLVAVYPRYETVYDGYVVQHVYNDYIEGLAETGMAAGICGLAFVWLLYRQARKGFAAEGSALGWGIRAGAVAGVSGLLLHSFVDFNLHIPSNAMLFLLQAFLATCEPLARGVAGAERGRPAREYSPAGN